MGILSSIKGWVKGMFKGQIKELFEVEPITTAKMEEFVKMCQRIYNGRPDWIDIEDDVKTINAAKTICAEAARLVTLAAGIKVDGSPRADYIQKQIDRVYFSFRKWVEYGIADGTMALKPDGNGNIECYQVGEFVITHKTGDVIDGGIFLYAEKVIENKKDVHYTMMEYHHFDDEGIYHIEHRCFKGISKYDTKSEVPIDVTPWAGIEDSEIEGLEKPLFAVFRMPEANNVDRSSEAGMPIFANSIEELRDLDVAYSRKATEIDDSKRSVLIDSDKMIGENGNRSGLLDRAEQTIKKMRLPRFVRMVEGDGTGDFYQEINPTLNTIVRQEGIDAIMAQIGYKCGFSNGYFVFDAKTGMVTATQVESDDRRTIGTIKDIRDQFEACLDALIYSLNAMADLYELAPSGEYESNYDFGDITYNREEDRARWWSYVMSGKVPAWRFFVKFEGMTEDEAKEMVAEAAAANMPLDSLIAPE